VTVIVAIIGSALIIGSCVGTAWLLARFGIVPVEEITSRRTHVKRQVGSAQAESPSRLTLIDLSRPSSNYAVVATYILSAAAGAVGGMIRTGQLVTPEGTSKWSLDSVACTSTSIVTVIHNVA
jgi:hypothetical protein